MCGDVIQQMFLISFSFDVWLLFLPAETELLAYLGCVRLVRASVCSVESSSSSSFFFSYRLLYLQPSSKKGLRRPATTSKPLTGERIKATAWHKPAIRMLSPLVRPSTWDPNLIELQGMCPAGAVACCCHEAVYSETLFGGFVGHRTSTGMEDSGFSTRTLYCTATL